MRDAFSSGIKRWWASFAREQQTALVILIVCGTLGFAFSFVYLRQQIRSPFDLSLARVLRAEQALREKTAAVEQEDPSEQTLRERDTDRDGLSDWMELNAYRTSPYLSDSDSDGIPDSVEIAQGADPNCPKDKQCGAVGAAEAFGVSSSTFSDLLSASRIVPSPREVTLGDASGTSGAQAFLENPPEPASMNGAETRAYLKANHLVSEEDLQKLPDDMVKQIYTAAYQEAIRIRAAQQPSQ